VEIFSLSLHQSAATVFHNPDELYDEIDSSELMLCKPRETCLMLGHAGPEYGLKID
jgi:hypothetical protein